ncbi:MAG: DAK2 domain-containing protein [Anaerolineae bacterium]
MIVEVKKQICDGHLYKWLIAAGLAWLEHNQERVNQLNVFPVPDGDTGTNMLLTMKRAYEEIAHMNEGHVGIVAEGVARGALMGARGNSGVILSQLLRGFAQRLQGQEEFDSLLFAEACKTAVDMAYKAVITPVEGTILTVARLAKDAVVEEATHETSLSQLLTVMVEAGFDALQKTPDLLPILKKAGVVDSGGQGFVYILEGMMRLLRGEVVSMSRELVRVDGEQWQEALVPEDEEGYGYDVQFLMHGQHMDVNAVRATIDAMGWSTLVVGDDKLIKVHVHVHDPGQPISYAIGLGVNIDDVVVENMQLQYQGYVEERIGRETGTGTVVEGAAVITVASGDGMRKLFTHDLQAAHVVSGGQTMNPSAEDFLAAIDKIANDEIILLPNNKNIIMAARQAASLARDKHVRVVPSRSLQQGIAAMFAYVNARETQSTLDEITQQMTEALGSVISCDVTNATRSVEFEGVNVEEGQFIGLLDGNLVVTGNELFDVVCELLKKAKANDKELVTLYFGSGQDESQAHALVDYLVSDFGSLEFEIVAGGQPLYPYLISIE